MARALLHAAALTWIGAAWFLGGMLLMPARLRREDPFLVAASSLVLAAGVTALSVSVLGWTSLLYSGALWAIQIGWTIAAIVVVITGRAKINYFSRQRWDWWSRIAVATVIATAGLTLIGVLAPPTSMDATIYHLRIPREFLRAHRIVPLFDDARTFQPLDVEMLLIFGMGIMDDVLAASLHWLLGIGVALIAAAWARRLGARSYSTAAALVFVSPLVVWESTSCFIDLGLALFTAVGLLWATRDDLGVPALSLAIISAGLAAGSKYNGCACAVLIGIAASWVTLPNRHSSASRFLAVGAGAVFISSPWYLRNVVATGNPFYPLANRLWHVPEVPFASAYGLGTDFLHLLSSPFDLVWRGAAFDVGWALGPAFLALLPVAFLMNRTKRSFYMVAGLLALYWLFWFYSSPQTRFLLPVTPLAAAVAAVGFDGLSVTNALGKACARIIVGLSVMIGLGSAFVVASTSWRAVATIETRSAFLRRLSWNYAIYEQVNSRLGPDDAHLAAFGVTNVYYLPPGTTMVNESDPVRLGHRGFTHLLRVGECDKISSPTQTEIWRGSFSRSGSRFQGTGESAQVCADLLPLVQ